jgi:hypothetical protein
MPLRAARWSGATLHWCAVLPPLPLLPQLLLPPLLQVSATITACFSLLQRDTALNPCSAAWCMLLCRCRPGGGWRRRCPEPLLPPLQQTPSQRAGQQTVWRRQSTRHLHQSEQQSCSVSVQADSSLPAALQRVGADAAVEAT